MLKEVTIKIRSDETTISEKFLIYEPLLLSPDDKTLKELVASVLSKLNDIQLSDPEIVIKIKMTWWSVPYTQWEASAYFSCSSVNKP